MGGRHWEVDRDIFYTDINWMYDHHNNHIDEQYLMRIDSDEADNEQFEEEEILEGDVVVIEVER